MANIKIIKLLTGEELIGDIEDKGLSYSVKNAVLIALVPSRNNPQQPSIGLGPWLPYAENEPVMISKQSIVYEAKPVKEMINNYNSIFGGIITPPKTLLV
jgi:hypothetical protein